MDRFTAAVDLAIANAATEADRRHDQRRGEAHRDHQLLAHQPPQGGLDELVEGHHDGDRVAGQTEEQAGEYAEDLAASMLAETLGIEFDIDKDYDERREVYRMSGKIVESQNIRQGGHGVEGNLWTTVIASALFVK